ncbi:MAG: hypothetical protein WBD27_03060 [Pyrinomonadaceae bacterium]
MKFYQSIVICILLLIFNSALWAIDPKEVISRHLDSIASADKRTGLKTLFAMGLSEFESKIPIVKGGGKAIVVSDPENLYFLMSLNSRQYPFEKIGAFDGNISLPFISPGQRSILGAFLADNSKILSEGLFCGSMSLRWLNHIEDTARLKMKSVDTRKINGRETYAIDVLLSGSGSGRFRVRLFFDSENFRHVRSEYHREVDIGSIIVRQQNQLQNASVDLTEEFSEFKEVDGFTLPYIYKVSLTTNNATQSYETSWGIRVTNYYLNQKLEPSFFTFEVK